MTNSSGTNLDREAGRAAVDSTDGVRNLTRISKTGKPQVIPARDDRLSISVPIQIKRRNGRKLVTDPTAGRQRPLPWDDEPTPLQLRTGPWAPVARHGRVRRGKVAPKARQEGRGGQQLREPDG